MQSYKWGYRHENFVKTDCCCQVSRDESLSFSQTFLTFSSVLNIILFVLFRLDIFYTFNVA